MASKNNLAKKDQHETIKRLERKEKSKALLTFLSAIALAVKLIFHIDVPDVIVNIAVDIILGAGAVWGWFRNNYISPRGIKQLHVLKNSKLQ